jgi:hypothetical protein
VSEYPEDGGNSTLSRRQLSSRNKIAAFCVMTQDNLVGGYECFGGKYCLSLQDFSPKVLYPGSGIYGVITKNITI